jgi:hypothetical protein
VWIKEAHLRICYPKIYNIYRDTHMSVSKGAEQRWQLDLRRMMGLEEVKEWEDLMEILNEVNLNNEDDAVYWGLTAKKIFLTASLYRFLTSGGTSYHKAKKIWKCKIPLKIRIFLWQVFHNRI